MIVKNSDFCTEFQGFHRMLSSWIDLRTDQSVFQQRTDDSSAVQYFQVKWRISPCKPGPLFSSLVCDQYTWFTSLRNVRHFQFSLSFMAVCPSSRTCFRITSGLQRTKKPFCSMTLTSKTKYVFMFLTWLVYSGLHDNIT